MLVKHAAIVGDDSKVFVRQVDRRFEILPRSSRVSDVASMPMVSVVARPLPCCPLCLLWLRCRGCLVVYLVLGPTASTYVAFCYDPFSVKIQGSCVKVGWNG